MIIKENGCSIQPFVLVATLFVGCFLSCFDSTLLLAQSGTQVGDSFGFSRWNLISRPHAIAVDSVGNPFVAWDRYSFSNGSSRIFVSAFDGTDWLSVGGEVNAAVQNVVIDDLEIDLFDRPVVAWSASTSRYSPRRQWVSRWEDDRWVLLGGGPVDREGERSVFGAKLEIGPFSEPILSWTESVGANSRYVSFIKMWNERRWLPVGIDAGRIRFRVSDLEATVREDGTPLIYAAVGEIDTPGNVRPDRLVLYRFNGVRWVRLPNEIERVDPDEVVFALDVDLELQSNGRPILFWTEGPTPSKTPWLARYSAEGWEYFDTSTLPSGHALVVRGNRQPVVAIRNSPSLQSSLSIFRYGLSSSPLIEGEWQNKAGRMQQGTGIQVVSHGTSLFTAVYDREQGVATIVVRRY